SSYDFFALGIVKFLPPPDEIRLDLMLVLETFFCHQVLNKSRFFPLVRKDFVTPDMHVSRIGKQIDHLVEYVVKKLKRLPAWAQNLFEDSPRGLHLVIVAVGAAKFRICRERGGRMARQLDLGDRGNVSLPGILHDIFY